MAQNGSILQQLMEIGYSYNDIVIGIRAASNPEDINQVIQAIESHKTSKSTTFTTANPTHKQLPSGWTKHYTKENKPYYQDHKTQKTYWSVPEWAYNQTPSAPSTTQTLSTSSESTWNIGDICYRKSEKCIIKAIHYNTNPPTVTVSLHHNSQHEINTEFSYISKSPQIHQTPKSPKYETNRPLPSGWTKHYTEDNKPYYQHIKTKTTYWNIPESAYNKDNVTNKGNGDGDNNQLPPGWKKLYTDDGKPYYVSPTGTSHWDPPKSRAKRAVSTPDIHQQPGMVRKKIEVPIQGSYQPFDHSDEGVVVSPAFKPKSKAKEVLPKGWTKHITADGKVYYQDHINHTTHWSLPNVASSGHTRSASAMHVTSPSFNNTAKKEVKTGRDAVYWQELGEKCAMTGDYEPLLNEMENSEELKNIGGGQRQGILAQIQLLRSYQQRLDMQQHEILKQQQQQQQLKQTPTPQPPQVIVVKKVQVQPPPQPQVIYVQQPKVSPIQRPRLQTSQSWQHGVNNYQSHQSVHISAKPSSLSTGNLMHQHQVHHGYHQQRRAPPPYIPNVDNVARSHSNSDVLIQKEKKKSTKDVAIGVGKEIAKGVVIEVGKELICDFLKGMVQ